MAPTIEFICGEIVNAGMVDMAIRAHMNKCTNDECIKDCEKELNK